MLLHMNMFAPVAVFAVQLLRSTVSGLHARARAFPQLMGMSRSGAHAASGKCQAGPALLSE
jgi:hypothetical protein